MKHRSKDVTANTNPRHMPPTHYINTPGAVREQSPTPARRAPITPPTPVSGFGETGMHSRECNHFAARHSSLPGTISAKQVYQKRFADRRMNFSLKK